VVASHQKVGRVNIAINLQFCYSGEKETSPHFGEQMRHNVNDLTLDELNMLMLALDFYLCNGEHNTTIAELAESLLLHLDWTTEAAEALDDSNRVLEQDDNLIVVNFRPKNG
jgi:hypothetical protein